MHIVEERTSEKQKQTLCSRKLLALSCSVSEAVRDWTVSSFLLPLTLAVKTQGGSLYEMTFTTIKKSLLYKTGLT